MRIPENPISPMTIFWQLVYALALLSISTAGILARIQDATRAPASKPIRSNRGFRP